MANIAAGQHARRTASGSVKTTSGVLLGFYVASTTAGTIQFYDDAAAGIALPITGLITPAIGWHELPVGFGSGLNAVIGGVLDVTIVYL